MTASDVKWWYENYCRRTGEDGHFFDRATMRFFGDRISNFGVRSAVIKTWEDKGIANVEVWDLYRRRPVNGGLHGHCAYFRKDNGKLVYNHE